MESEDHHLPHSHPLMWPRSRPPSPIVCTLGASLSTHALHPRISRLVSNSEINQTSSGFLGNWSTCCSCCFVRIDQRSLVCQLVLLAIDHHPLLTHLRFQLLHCSHGLLDAQSNLSPQGICTDAAPQDQNGQWTARQTRTPGTDVARTASLAPQFETCR